MGVWTHPGNKQSVKELERILSKPLPAGTATETIYGIVGSDSLFDAIDWVAKNYADDDVRGLVASETALWAASAIDPEGICGDEVGTWLKPWDEGIPEKVLEVSLDAMEKLNYPATYPLSEWLASKRTPGL